MGQYWRGSQQRKNFIKMALQMEGGMKCVKYLLFAFNLIFLITGLALIITGCVIQGVYSNYLDFLGDSFFNTPVLLVVVGCIIFFVTFFGCWYCFLYKDWTNTTFSESSNSVPDSCCLSDVEGCGNGILVKPDEEVPKIIYTTGCLGKLERIIEHNVAALGGIGVGIAIIQFAEIIFACVLAATIRKGYETV